MLGRYIDSLPVHARDRLIRAQDWCVAGVLGPRGGRCLVGHAEDWQPWSDAAHERVHEATRGTRHSHGHLATASDLELLCLPALFAFRRSHPADLEVYRLRLQHWGASSEATIGRRFDGLCGRLGRAKAVRIAKARAAREFMPGASIDSLHDAEAYEALS